MLNYRKWSAILLIGIVAGCGDIDGPSQGDFVGDWRVVSVDNKPLPAIITSSSGMVRTKYSSLLLVVPASGGSAFSYQISDLSPDDGSEVVTVACSGPVTIATKSDTLTLHASTLELPKCPANVVEGERFVRSGDEMLYNWNGHVAKLKR